MGLIFLGQQSRSQGSISPVDVRTKSVSGESASDIIACPVGIQVSMISAGLQAQAQLSTTLTAKMAGGLAKLCPCSPSSGSARRRADRPRCCRIVEESATRASGRFPESSHLLPPRSRRFEQKLNSEVTRLRAALALLIRRRLAAQSAQLSRHATSPQNRGQLRTPLLER